MSSEWSEVTVEEIAASQPFALATGPFGSSISSKYFVDSGFPVIRGSNLTANTSVRLIDDGLVFISPEKAAEFQRSIVRRGDLVFTCWGTINQVGLIDKRSRFAEYVVSNKQMKLSVDLKKTDSLFIYYVFSGPEKQAEILDNGIGSSVPGFNLGQLKKHKLLLPPLKEQKHIAGLLSLLDDRITLLRETNATLEAIAQALFKSWFVDFDPVRAKAEGLEPQAMDATTAALFPDSFEESELGLVPKGWCISKLSAVSGYLSRGVSPKYVDLGGVLVINQKCIRDFSVDYAKARRHDSSQRNIDGRFLAVGDVLVNSTGVGTLGRVAQILELPEQVIVDSHVTVVRAGSTLSWPYLGQWMARKQPDIEAMGEGSTGQTELSKSKLGDLSILVPLAPVLSAFDEVVMPLKSQIALNENKVKTLTQLRDSLLPRLISGQLRLPEALAAIEDDLA
ncbi:restriction endonuclease subunit S [Pseudomonas tumuqii]|uniref:restriction endonuclease subunit S n=1 Tax=Pseudomonas tumuqii TaxID=2715755 RepID=UPI00155279DE|nr:restriction endonuclease subunit S [Pseudomonas tumuqii]